MERCNLWSIVDRGRCWEVHTGGAGARLGALRRDKSSRLVTSKVVLSTVSCGGRSRSDLGAQ
eukprot:scaffold86051_cov45-Phaeocystis_antarctica.AAC.2